MREALAACRGGFLAVAVFSFFVNLLMMTAPLYMLQLFTRVLTSRSVDTLYLLMIIAIGALFAMALLDMLRGFVLIRIGTWIDNKLSGAVLEASVDEALASAGGASVQGLRDLSTIRGFLSGSGVVPLLDVPWSPLFLLVMFLLHPLVGWVGLGGFLIILGFAVANELATRGLFLRAGGACGFW